MPSGPVTAAPGDSPITPAPTVTNGNGRQSQYDAEALMGFVLTT